jgi:antitoxin CcdA
MAIKPAPKKRAVNVSIDPALAAEAKEFGTNMSAVLERALKAEHKTHREAKWKRENREQIQNWNRLIDEEGLWADKYRD